MTCSPAPLIENPDEDATPGLTEPEPVCLPALPNEVPQPAGTVASFDQAAFEVSEGRHFP